MANSIYSIEVRQADGTVVREKFKIDYAKVLSLDGYFGTVVVDDILRTDGGDLVRTEGMSKIATYFCVILVIKQDSPRDDPKAGPFRHAEDTYITIPPSAVFKTTLKGQIEIWA